MYKFANPRHINVPLISHLLSPLWFPVTTATLVSSVHILQQVPCELCSLCSLAIILAYIALALLLQKFEVHSLIILLSNDYCYFSSCRLSLFHIDLRFKGYVERAGALRFPSSCLTEAKKRSPMDVGDDSHGGFPRFLGTFQPVQNDCC